MNRFLALIAVAILMASVGVTGVIDVNGGRGWDGIDYAAMITKGWDHGTANTALRPLIVLLNWPAFWLTGDVVAAFRAMNYAYAALLCVALSALFDRYNSDRAAKFLFTLNAFSSIAITKMAAYYPVLVDVGAYAFVTIAVWAVVAGRRLVAGAACVTAVLAREFAIAVVCFGIARDVRLRVEPRRIALTYGPALVVFAGWRTIVALHWAAGDGGDLVSFARLVGHLATWRDPVFVAFFLYFLASVFGGVSAIVLARLPFVARRLRGEPEWVAYAAIVLAAAAMGEADIWRYLAYLLPVFTVGFAVCARELHMPRRALGLSTLVCAATWITQRPMQAMDVPAYFRDWFPYYIQKGNVPFEPIVPLWPIWAWRLLTLAGLFWAMAFWAMAVAAASGARNERVSDGI